MYYDIKKEKELYILLACYIQQTETNEYVQLGFPIVFFIHKLYLKIVYKNKKKGETSQWSKYLFSAFLE